MTYDGRAGLHFAPAGWNFAEELVKETGAKLALPSCYIYVFICFYCLLECICFKKYQNSACLNTSAKISYACLDGSALENTKPVPA